MVESWNVRIKHSFSTLWRSCTYLDGFEVLFKIILFSKMHNIYIFLEKSKNTLSTGKKNPYQKIEKILTFFEKFKSLISKIWSFEKNRFPEKNLKFLKIFYFFFTWSFNLQVENKIFVVIWFCSRFNTGSICQYYIYDKVIGRIMECTYQTFIFYVMRIIHLFRWIWGII